SAAPTRGASAYEEARRAGRGGLSAGRPGATRSESGGMATLTCPRCGRPGTGFAGCPRCRAEGVAVNLVPPLADLRGRDLAAYPGGPWGWSATLARPGGPRPTESLPTGPLPTGPSLGEGNTPL